MDEPTLPAILSVSELTDYIKEILEGAFPTVTIEGEISNCRPSSTGHLYFVLKDDKASISAVMFKGKMRNLSFTPADGMLVQASGQLSVYAQRGSYQIVVDTMTAAGSGAILKQLEERKQRLAAEGLFDSERKRKLPAFPAVVGVVTSPTGAALRDILQITERRNNSVSVVVLPCQVQGQDAAAAIVKQIEAANEWRLADVLIVGRGGGSLEDLLPFSDERVVRAIAASAIPTVSAVGHEIDWALSDFAADVRAPTPSAAAELVIPEKAAIVDSISRITETLTRILQSKLERMRLLVNAFTPESMEMRFRSIEQPLLMRFDDAKVALLDNMKTLVDAYRLRIDNTVRDLVSANPKTILARGYAMVRNAETGRIIRSNRDTALGASIEIIPAEGKITANVTQTEERTNE
jgi:exodeoxyribonuclease VII large subunit